MKQLLAALAICLSLGLAVAGCGGDDDNGNGDGGGSAATTEQTATTEKQAGGSGKAAEEKASGGKTFDVDIVDIDYDPKDAKVKKGTTVKWTNTGNLPHTVTKDSGPGEDFDSGTIQPGDSFEETFTSAGKVGYLCTIHAGQTGSLTVE